MNNETTPALLSAEEEKQLLEWAKDAEGFMSNFGEQEKSHGETLLSTLLSLAAANARADSLAAWKCSNCGARFEQSIPTKMLNGVELCSWCVEVEQLDRALQNAERVCCEQAEHNGELMGRIAELEEAARWIPLSEQEPELDEERIEVWDKVMGCIIVNLGTKGWVDHWAWTHWRRIPKNAPEPPKEHHAQ